MLVLGRRRQKERLELGFQNADGGLGGVGKYLPEVDAGAGQAPPLQGGKESVRRGCEELDSWEGRFPVPGCYALAIGTERRVCATRGGGLLGGLRLWRGALG